MTMKDHNVQFYEYDWGIKCNTIHEREDQDHR